METPDPLVGDYLIARQRRDQAQAELDEIQSRLMKQMEADQRKTYRWSASGHTFSVSYTQGHTTVIDEKGLRRALTAKVYDKYTKKVLDRKAMESAMDAGVIDPITVSQFVTLQPNKPHLTLREKEATHEA
jgi:hypothetical protein